MSQHHRAYWMALVAAPVLFVGGIGHHKLDTSQTGVIPDWSVFQSAPLLRVGQTDFSIVPSGTSSATSGACPSILEFSVSEQNVGVRFDSTSKLTELYAGYFGGNCVVRHSIDSLLGHSESALPMPYGDVWDVADLDCDGNIELVLQRGDGSNGFLDIVSSPSWNLRRRFTYPGMNVYMHARAVNIDDDPYLELYLVPHSFGSGRAVLIDYRPDSAEFIEIANVEAPWLTAGDAAIGDFDNDGRFEFISGNRDGYGIFEWRDGQLNYIGNIGEPYGGYAATECKPKPDGILYALVGYGDDIGRYQLFRPVGDNQFELEHVFLRPTGYTGIHPSQAADVDCDGMDELVMSFPPQRESWEWDVSADSFVQICVWGSEYKTISAWYPLDLDQNSVPEWGNINSDLLFHDFPGSSCAGCDPTGHCVPPLPSCLCACHGDPSCDGVTDVLDVVETIDVAFRGSPEQNDPGPLCGAMQTDVDCSTATDVLDVIKVVNVAFRGASPVTEFCDPCGQTGP